MRGLRADGTAFDMEVSASLYREHHQDHTLVILRDVTDRNRAEREIAERGIRLQQVLDTASVAIFLVDRNGRITLANERMAEMFSCTIEDLVGSEYVDYVHPSEREESRKKMLALLASEMELVDLERKYWKKNGTEFWGHLTGRRQYDVSGRQLGLIGVITDIEKRKQAETAVRESEERFRRLVEQSPIAISIIDGTGRIEYSNRKHVEIVGYTVEEIPSLEDWWALAYPDAPTRRRIMNEWGALSRRILRGVDVEPIERTIICKDGSSKDVEMRFSLAGEKILAVFADITGRKRPRMSCVQAKSDSGQSRSPLPTPSFLWTIRAGSFTGIPRPNAYSGTQPVRRPGRTCTCSSRRSGCTENISRALHVLS